MRRTYLFFHKFSGTAGTVNHLLAPLFIKELVPLTMNALCLRSERWEGMDQNGLKALPLADLPREQGTSQDAHCTWEGQFWVKLV